MDQKKSLIAVLSVLVVVLAGALLYSVANNKPATTVSPTQNSDKQSDKSNTENPADINTTKNDIQYRTVKLFYYDYSKGECIGYSYPPEGMEDQRETIRKGLVPVERKIVDSDKIIEDTVRLFLEGKLTDEEQKQGIESQFPLRDDVKLTKVSLGGDGKLSLSFEGTMATRGVYCSVEEEKQQLEATVKQFPEVKSVEFLPLGEAFVVDDF